MTCELKALAIAEVYARKVKIKRLSIREMVIHLGVIGCVAVPGMVVAVLIKASAPKLKGSWNIGNLGRKVTFT